MQNIRIEVAKKTKKLEDEIRDLKTTNANENKDNQALINIIIDLAQKADKKENAYELHYDLGKTLFEQERIERIQRLNGLNHDRGDLSL